MRFNAKELAVVARQMTAADKEGVLYIKEKQDSIFKRTEVYVDRYFKLKGNLLFYFKNKELKSEPLGVLILERCTVELDLEDEAVNSFVLVCEGEENSFKFAATTEEERDSWIQALHMASYECLKMQLQSLREQLQARTGRDPVTLPDCTSTGLDLDLQADAAVEDPVLEIALSCSDLPIDAQGHPPNALVIVHIILPHQQQLWVHHNHTEIAEKNNNPLFLKTIGFGDSSGVDTSTRVRLTVYNVKERMTGTMAQLGQAIFSLQDVLMAPELILTLILQSHDVRSNGKITIMAWINDNKMSPSDLQKTVSSSSSSDQRSSAHSRTLSLGYARDSLRQHFDNIIKRSFRFASNSESSFLQVHEYMAEFQHLFNIPIQLLRIWIDEEKQKNSLLQDLGELWPEWEAQQITWITLAARTAEHYTNSLDSLVEYTESTFKRSVDKDKPELEFVAVNLHLERIAVSSDTNDKGAIYDILTMGAATAFNKRYKNGGLRRMLQQQRSSHTAESTLGGRTKLQRACSLRNTVTDLRTSIKALGDRLAVVSKGESFSQLQAVLESLVEQTRLLIRHCEDPVLCEAAEMYLQAKRQGTSDSPAASPPSCSQNRTSAQQSKSSESKKRWSGSDLVRSPTVEPWEVTRLNLEAAVVCLVSSVDNVIQTGSAALEPTTWEGELNSGIVKLQQFVDMISAKVSLFLTFLTMMENKDNIQKMHEIKYRRDIVNSHMVSSMLDQLMDK